jgi:hypothetical protein
MNNYASKCIEKYLGRKFTNDEIKLKTDDAGNIIITLWLAIDKPQPNETDISTIFTVNEKQLYQDILTAQLDVESLPIYLLTGFNTWKSSDATYQEKLAKINAATKAKLKRKIENSEGL